MLHSRTFDDLRNGALCVCTCVLPPVPAGASVASLITSAVAYTREPNQVKPSLPLFWDCEWSHEYDRWYYINEKCVRARVCIPAPVPLHRLRCAAADCHLTPDFRTMVTTWDVPTGPADGPDEDDESDSSKPSQHQEGDDTNSETPFARQLLAPSHCLVCDPNDARG